MKKNINRSFFLTLLALFIYGGMPADAATITHNIATNSLTIAGTSTDDYIITGTSNDIYRVIIKSGYQGTITLDNLTIISSTQAPIRIEGQYNCSNDTPVTKVNVILKGTNKLESTASNYPAFQVDQGAQIHISAIDPTDDTSGSLDASASTTSSAGIGAGYNTTNNSEIVNSSAGGNQGVAVIYNANGGVKTAQGVTAGGNVIVSSGTVTASGGHGAGIGGAFRNYYNGKIIIYGGHVTSAGGPHSAGIGTGCPNGEGNDGTKAANSAIIVIPPGSITATTKQSGKPGLAGAANITYVGDPQSHLVYVKTEGEEKFADIYADLSETVSVADIFSKLGLSHDLTKVKFGDTGSSGQLQIRANFAQQVTFFTDASSTAPATMGRPYKPVKTIVDKPLTVTLPLLATRISLEAIRSTPLELGYTEAQALQRAQRAKITYSDPAPMTAVSFGLQKGAATDFGSMKFYAANGTTEINTPSTLTNGTVYYVSIPLKAGKPQQVYSDVFRFSGMWEGESTGYIRQVVSQRVALNDTETNGQIKVTASPASFAASDAAAATASLSLSITHAGQALPYDPSSVVAKYLVTTQPDYDLALAATPHTSWPNLSVPASDGAIQTTTAHFNNLPNASYYIHWYVESGTVFAHSKTVISPAALYGGFGPYVIDTVAPTVTLKVNGQEAATSISDLSELPVTFEFSEPISDPTSHLTAADFEIQPTGAASISAITMVSGGSSGGDNRNFTALLKPNNSLYNGQHFTLHLKAHAVSDVAGNDNRASNTVDVVLNNTTSPSINFKNAALYSSLRPSFSIEVYPNDFAINEHTELSLTPGGPSLITGTNLNALLVVKPEGGAPLTSGYTATYGKTGDGTGARGIVALTFTADLQNTRRYVVTLPANRMFNTLRNGNGADSTTFTIAQPSFSGLSAGITADPHLFGSSGGATILTIQGEGLKVNAESGLLSLRVTCPSINYNSGAITTGFTSSGGIDVLELSNVVLPPNTTTATRTHLFELFMTFENKTDASTGKSCLVQVEPDASHILRVVNTTASVGELTFGYTSATAQLPENRQEITVTNQGARTLNDLTVQFTGADGASFDHTAPAPATTLAPGNTATFYVYLQPGKNAGHYASSASSSASATKVLVKATINGASTSVTGESALVEQIVNPRNSDLSGTEGSVTGNPEPGPVWHNSPTLQLTATAAGAGDGVKDWKYAVVNTNTPPGPFDLAWTQVGGGATTATHSFPNNTDLEWHVFWEMNTNNISGITGQVQAGVEKVYRIDRVAPTVVSIVPERNTTNALPFKVMVNFSEPVAVVRASRFLAGNATVGTPNPVGIPVNGRYTSYEITLTPNPGLLKGDHVTFSVQEGAVADRARNDNVASGILQNPSITFDDTQPSVKLTTPVLTINRNFVVTITFSKLVTGLTESKFNVINGSILAGSLSGGGTLYSVTIQTSASTSGPIVVILPDHAAVDASGNGNMEGELMVEYKSPGDQIAALLTYSGPAYEKGSFAVNVSFSRNVTGLTAGDFTYLTSDFETPALSGSGKNYTLILTPKPNRDAMVDISLRTGIAARDEFGNELNGSNTVTVRYDTRPPRVSSVSGPAAQEIHYEPVAVKVVFDEVINGPFDPSKLSLSNLAFLGVKSGPVKVGASTEYELLVQVAPNVASGTAVTLQIGEGAVRDKAGNPNLAGQTPNTILTAIFVDNVPPTVINISPSGAQVPLGGNLVITFNEPMDPNAGSVHMDGGVGQLTAGKWLDDRTFTIPYGMLYYDETYTVTFSGFSDLAGNLLEPVLHSFTTQQLILPIILRRITLQTGEGLVTTPPEGIHYVHSQHNFVFTVQVLPGYDPKQLKVTTGVPLRDREGIRMETNEDGSIKVTILRVTEPLTVTVELNPDQANEPLLSDGPMIWACDQVLYVVSDKAAELHIFSLSGQSILQESVGAGRTEIRLEQGIYVVTLGDVTRRILIQ